jgi:transposase
MRRTTPAARRIKSLQSRRNRAAALFRQGVTQAEVARRLGVTASAACRWYAAWKDGGREGLQIAERLGRPPRLEEGQRAFLQQELLRGAAAHGFVTDLWTLPRIAELIQRLFGVHYHPGHVWRVLRGLGWSLQRPTTRARERDEEAIIRWQKTTWPRLKKTHDATGR